MRRLALALILFAALGTGLATTAPPAQACPNQGCATDNGNGK